MLTLNPLTWLNPLNYFPRYQTRTVRTHRAAERLVTKGWEVVSTSGAAYGFLAASGHLRITLRKPTKRYQRRLNQA